MLFRLVVYYKKNTVLSFLSFLFTTHYSLFTVFLGEFVLKITFVYGGFESIGVEYLSAVLKRDGFKTSLVYAPKLFNDTMSEIPILAKLLAHEKAIVKRVLKEKADLVAFSVVTDDLIWCRRISKMIKKLSPKTKIIWGGIHVTSIPENAIKEKAVDYICIGEGELAFLELCQRLRDKKDDTNVKNIWTKKGDKIYKNPVRPLLEDLDWLPFPDKDLFYEKAPYNKEHYTTMATRGCILNCAFCHHNIQRKVYRGHKYDVRERSPENVIKELVQANKKYDFRHILFEDDLFLHDKEWIRKFTRLYRESGINKKWFCITHAWKIDEEIAGLLSEAGCAYIEVGVQTLNSKVRKGSLGRPEKTHEIMKALGILKKYGIGFNCDHLAGVFGEDEESLIFSAKYYNYIRPNRIYLLFLTLYPGTDIGRIAMDKGYASIDDLNLKIKGEGGTTTHGGSVKDPVFDYYRLLFGWMPLLPKSVNRYLIRTRIFKKMPKAVFIASVIPETLSAILSDLFDFRGPVIIKKYIHHILRGGF